MQSPKAIAPKLGWVVGRNLRDLRVERDWTQDDVARQLRFVGLPWTRSHVAAMEGERRDDVALAELLFLSVAFGVRPERWLEGEGPIQLGRHLVAPLKQLREILSGTPKRAALSESAVTGVLEWRLVDQLAVVADLPDAAFQAYRQVPSDAERNAAKSLDLDPVAVYELACRLWNHGLDEEREARLEEDGRPLVKKTAYRGHTTRQLIGELRTEIERGGGRRGAEKRL